MLSYKLVSKNIQSSFKSLLSILLGLKNYLKYDNLQRLVEMVWLLWIFKPLFQKQ
jgi:hypothetical protein